ncbi:MAG TPA: hypothetical protein VIS73_03750, partial [Rhodocyclaceae bacterium]
MIGNLLQQVTHRWGRLGCASIHSSTCCDRQSLRRRHHGGAVVARVGTDVSKDDSIELSEAFAQVPHGARQRFELLLHLR